MTNVPCGVLVVMVLAHSGSNFLKRCIWFLLDIYRYTTCTVAVSKYNLHSGIKRVSVRTVSSTRAEVVQTLGQGQRHIFGVAQWEILAIFGDSLQNSDCIQILGTKKVDFFDAKFFTHVF